MFNSDPDVRAIRQAVHESIVAVKKQINLLGQRLLYSQRRVHDLQTKQQKGPIYKESNPERGGGTGPDPAA
jgi:hypothetical protein